MTARPQLDLLRIELLRSCPLACVHCSAESGPSRTESIPEAEAEKLIIAAHQLGASRLILTGGEPLEYDALASCAQVATSLGLHTILYTTGIVRRAKTLTVDRDLLTFVSEHINTFVFSFYSDNADEHDRVTAVPGSWQNTVNAASYLAKHGSAVSVSFLPLQQNYEDLVGVARLARSIHAHEVRVLRLIRQGRARRSRRISDPRPDSVASVIAKARNEVPGVPIRAGGAAGVYSADTRCQAPIAEAFVQVDGRATPCPAAAPARDDMPNSFASGLETVWRTSPLFQITRRLSQEGLNCQTHGCLARRALDELRGSVPARPIAVSSTTG